MPPHFVDDFCESGGGGLQFGLMSPEDRQSLLDRSESIERELQELTDGKTQPGQDVDFAEREGGLLDELDRIEYELGMDYIERNRR